MGSFVIRVLLFSFISNYLGYSNTHSPVLARNAYLVSGFSREQSLAFFSIANTHVVTGREGVKI
jgi:hypothetical protein